MDWWTDIFTLSLLPCRVTRKSFSLLSPYTVMEQISRLTIIVKLALRSQQCNGFILVFVIGEKV